MNPCVQDYMIGTTALEVDIRALRHASNPADLAVTRADAALGHPVSVES